MRNPTPPSHAIRRLPGSPKRRSGSALIVALWVILLLSLMIGSFAFEMKLESRLAGYYRQRLKAEQLAQSGIEKARFLLDQSRRIDPENPDDPNADKIWYILARQLKEGVGEVRSTDTLGDGELHLSIVPEPSLINVNELKSLSDWEAVLDYGGIPEEEWPKLFDAFMDWIDNDDVPHPDGAESDDYYLTLDSPYRAKNAPLDTVDELLLIKGFTNTYLYGGVLDLSDTGETNDAVHIRGIANQLTTYGSREINFNAASLGVLQSVSLDIDEQLAQEIIMDRDGDPELPKENTSYKNLEDFINRFSEYPELKNITKGRISFESKILRITSVGKVGDVTWTVSCIAEQGNGTFRLLRWQEETAL